MVPDEIGAEIEKMQERLREAYAKNAGSEVDQNLLDEALDELCCAVEELKAAESEMLSQNDALARSREQLEAERARYQELFEFAPSAYFVTDGRGVIIESNREAARLLGMEVSLLPHKPLVVFFGGEQRRDFFRLINSLIRAGNAEADGHVTPDEEGRPIELHEIAITPRLGPMFWADLTGIVIRNLTGRPAVIRWLMTDVTAARVNRLEMESLRGAIGRAADAGDVMSREICCHGASLPFLNAVTEQFELRAQVDKQKIRTV